MWTRKDDKQIKREHNKLLSFRQPLVWFAISFIGLIASVFSPRNAQGLWPKSWGQFLLTALVFAGITGIIVYLIQLILGASIPILGIHRKVVMCDKCHRVEHRDDIEQCDCGGRFDDIENWTWVDD